jgi:hypothetical protein
MEDEEDKKVYLGFIKFVGEEADGMNRYEFIFTDNPDEFWGDNFGYMPSGLINDLTPDDEYITEIHTVKTNIKFNLVQNSGCFSIQDAMDGIVSIGWEDISDYDEYPEDGRLFFNFGDEIEEVRRKLALKQIIMP